MSRVRCVQHPPAADVEPREMSDWQTKLLEKWREDSRKTVQQRETEAAAAEARMKAADEKELYPEEALGFDPYAYWRW